MKKILLLCLLLPFGGGLIAGAPAHRYGWKGDAPGKKATPFALHPRYAQMQIAAVSNLAPKMPPRRDQGNLGSCTGHGVGEVLDFAHHVRTGKFFDPAPLFIYYNERAAEGTVFQDEGAQIVDGITSIIKLGAPPECCWKYDVASFAVKPPAAAYQEALKYQALHAYKLDNGDGKSIRLALSNGFPVVFGCMVYPAIETLDKKNFVLPMPRKGERPIGGHCMVITGHSDARQLYTVGNSWGKDYGNDGFLCIPYAYIHSRRITEDCWVVDLAE